MTTDLQSPTIDQPSPPAAQRRADSELLYTIIDSPIGPLRLLGSERELWRITMDGQRWAPEQDPSWRLADEPFTAARDQLGEYFAGARREFELPLHLAGTPFQQRVWSALAAIPYGAHRSYGELARELGCPGASRAVGLANGRNPIAIVLPCHRVLGAGGALVGYAGGLERKAWLLDHEAGVLRL
jgi:methylated-DNA-[protein]-cysteine S-methyltransferase